MINTAKVRGRLAEMGLTQRDVASKECWDCALSTVSLKLNGERPITLDEADALAKFLKLNEMEYYVFFYTPTIA